MALTSIGFTLEGLILGGLTLVGLNSAAFDRRATAHPKPSLISAEVQTPAKSNGGSAQSC
jgi:hypothetical protein